MFRFASHGVTHNIAAPRLRRLPAYPAERAGRYPHTPSGRMGLHTISPLRGSDASRPTLRGYSEFHLFGVGWASEDAALAVDFVAYFVVAALDVAVGDSRRRGVIAAGVAALPGRGVAALRGVIAGVVVAALDEAGS